MTNAAVAAAVLLILPVLAACTQGEGPVVDQQREVGAFSRIEAGAGVQISVSIGPATPIVVHAQENIQDRISTGVRDDGTLRIEAVDDFMVADPVVIDVTVPQLTAVSLSGGAVIEMDGLEADAIDVTLTGGARATIIGTVTSLTLTARGGSAANLGDVDAETVSVNLAGGATAEVRASTSVSGTASGGANLTVAGDASVQVQASGGATITSR